MSLIKLSIITVSLNAVETIERTIQSVLDQKYTGYEYIIIDGNSTDGTIEIIKKYKDKLAFWNSEKDNGIYEAMNKGVRHARGEVVGFINADDWYEEDVFESIINIFNNENVDILYGNLKLHSKKEVSYYCNENSLLYSFSKHFPIIQPASFVRADLLKRYPFDEKYAIVSDAKWYWMANLRKFRFKYINETISNFTLGGTSSQIKKATYEWKKSALEVRAFEIERHFQYWKLLELDLEYEFERYLVKMIKQCFSEGVVIVGAGMVFDRLLPYLKAAGVYIVNIYDDTCKSIDYYDKQYQTISKSKINEENKRANFFIASEDYCYEILEELEIDQNLQRVVLFPTFFTDVVVEYLNEGKID